MKTVAFSSSYQKTREITLSCDVKISAVCSFILSQSTHVTDRQTDGENYDPQDYPSIAASHSNNNGSYEIFSGAVVKICTDSPQYNNKRLFLQFKTNNFLKFYHA